MKRGNRSVEVEITFRVRDDPLGLEAAIVRETSFDPHGKDDSGSCLVMHFRLLLRVSIFDVAIPPLQPICPLYSRVGRMVATGGNSGRLSLGRITSSKRHHTHKFTTQLRTILCMQPAMQPVDREQKELPLQSPLWQGDADSVTLSLCTENLRGSDLFGAAGISN